MEPEPAANNVSQVRLLNKECRMPVSHVYLPTAVEMAGTEGQSDIELVQATDNKTTEIKDTRKTNYCSTGWSNYTTT